MNMTITFRLPYRVEREGDVWVASCDALDVASQGDDRDDAGRMLAEALHLFLESCLERGTLEEVLRECGFEPAGDTAATSEHGNDYLDVPLSLLVAKQGVGQHAG